MQSEQKLHNYALWYINKYMPSLSRLESKLRSRCDSDSALPDKVLSLVAQYIDEVHIIRTTIEAGVFAGLGIRQIQTRLMRRGFNQELVRTISKEILQDQGGATMAQELRIQSMIDRAIAKGESVSLIRLNLLSKYREAQDLIVSLTENIDDRETLSQLFERDGIPETPKELARLQRKGFRYDDINRVIREIKG